MFFRKLSEQEKLERIAKRKKDRRKFIKFMFWYTIIGSVLLAIYLSIMKINVVESSHYAWIMSKEVASQARFEYAISTAIYDTPAKYKFSLSKDSKLSHWLLSKAYEHAKVKLPEDDPLLIILKFRRDTFEYKITEQNVAAYYQICIDAVKAIQNSSSLYKDYFIARSIIFAGAFLNNNDEQKLLRKTDKNKYIEFAELVCKDHKSTPITQIEQGEMSNNDLLAKYAVQIESYVFGESGCLLLSTSMFADNATKEACNGDLMNHLITKHNKLMKWFRKSIKNFSTKRKFSDMEVSAWLILKDLKNITYNNIRKDLVKICPSRAEELITVR